MKFAKLSVSLFLLIAFDGCSPREEKIDGSIFIVTQGGENFKLGLVTVSIFDQQQVEPYLTKATTGLEKSLKELKEQQKTLQEKQDKAASIRDDLEQQDEKAKDLADKTLQKMGGDETKRPEFSASDEVILDSDKSMLDSTVDDTTKSDYRKDMEGWERRKYEIAEMQTNWDLLKPTYLRQADEESQIFHRWQKASFEFGGYFQSLLLITDAVTNWPTLQPQIYFNNLPNPFAVAKTDADGKFSFQLPTKGEFVLVAQAQRQVADNVEKYFWLVRVHSDGKPEMQVLLSNDNLITANSPEVAVRFPTP
jgi:hypothetical protein